MSCDEGEGFGGGVAAFWIGALKFLQIAQRKVMSRARVRIKGKPWHRLATGQGSVEIPGPGWRVPSRLPQPVDQGPQGLWWPGEEHRWDQGLAG